MRTVTATGRLILLTGSVLLSIWEKPIQLSWGKSAAENDPPDLSKTPMVFSIDNFPNPFNPATQIQYTLPQAETVRLIIYNALGQQVRTLVSQRQPAGSYTVTWDTTDETGQKLGSGLYFYQLKAGELRAVKKMMYLK